nr:DUF4333 domain-containing protein [Streptomyces sp. SID13726]
MLAFFALVNVMVSKNRSTTELNRYDTVTVDGRPALKPKIVAGRILSLYHPLPWVGTELYAPSCPTGLKAVPGTTMTCTGTRHNGRTVEIPVTVVDATDTHITWKFER